MPKARCYGAVSARFLYQGIKNLSLTKTADFIWYQLLAP